MRLATDLIQITHLGRLLQPKGLTPLKGPGPGGLYRLLPGRDLLKGCEILAVHTCRRDSVSYFRDFKMSAAVQNQPSDSHHLEPFLDDEVNRGGLLDWLSRESISLISLLSLLVITVWLLFR